MSNRRSVVIDLRIAEETVAPVRFCILVWDVGLRHETYPVRDARAHDANLEARRLSNGPRRHVTAVAPSSDAETISICNSSLDESIYSVDDITELLTSHIAYVTH